MWYMWVVGQPRIAEMLSGFAFRYESYQAD